MISFYLSSREFILFTGALLFVALMAEAVNLSFGFRSLEQVHIVTLENLREFAVLVEMTVFILLLADTLFHFENGFVYPGLSYGLRRGIFLILCIFALLCSVKTGTVLQMIPVIPSMMSLPLAEKIPGFRVLFCAAVIFWMVRSFVILGRSFLRKQKRLMSNSIKEALDQLDSGLLFSYKTGQILLQNQLMQKLMVELTGRLRMNGRYFYEDLLKGNVLASCKKIETGSQISYCLPDGRIWSFHVTLMNRKKKVLVVASDVTEWYKSRENIQKQNQKLEKKNKELQALLENLDEICKEEVVLQAKGRVHDMLGQSISLLLRAMREHREPDAVLLQSFAEGLPKELKEISADGGYSLDTLAKVFKNLGVTVQIDGWLPEQEIQARIF